MGQVKRSSFIQRVMFTSISLLLIWAFILWLLLIYSSEPAQSRAATTPPTAPEEPVGSPVHLVDPGSPEDSPGATVHHDERTEAEPDPQRSLTDEQASSVFQAALKEQYLQVASHYEQSMRFPAYSTPLSTSDWGQLNPNAFVPQKKSLGNSNDLEVEILLPTFIVHKHQSLPVTVQVTSRNTPVSQVDAMLLANTGGQRTQIQLSSSADGSSHFQGNFTTAQLQKLTAGEYQIQAQLRLDDGRTASTGMPFKLVDTDAFLTTVGASYVETAHLMIPVEFAVARPGYYQVAGNLFDAQTGQPVTHLSTRMMLTEETPTGVLKVHAETLRHKGLAGPYTLTQLNIKRLPAHPGDATGYGASTQAHFPVNGFPLESYSNTPYQNTQNERRLNFLRQLAGEG